MFSTTNFQTPFAFGQSLSPFASVAGSQINPMGNLYPTTPQTTFCTPSISNVPFAQQGPWNTPFAQQDLWNTPVAQQGPWNTPFAQQDLRNTPFAQQDLWNTPVAQQGLWNDTSISTLIPAWKKALLDQQAWTQEKVWPTMGISPIHGWNSNYPYTGSPYTEMGISPVHGWNSNSHYTGSPYSEMNPNFVKEMGMFPAMKNQIGCGVSGIVPTQQMYAHDLFNANKLGVSPLNSMMDITGLLPHQLAGIYSQISPLDVIFNHIGKPVSQNWAQLSGNLTQMPTIDPRMVGGNFPINVPVGTQSSAVPPASNVRYIDNDSETIIDCFLPGINTELTEVVSIGNEIRIRGIHQNATTGTLSGQTFLSLPLPQLGDGSKLKAQAINDFLRITVPTAANITSKMQKVRPVKIS